MQTIFKPHQKPGKKKKKPPSGVDKKYIEWIKKQECCNKNCIGFVGSIIPAHQRILGRGGIGIKPPDKDALPLCFLCHQEEHAGAVKFWKQGTKAKTKVFVQNLCDEKLMMYKQTTMQNI